LNIYAHIDYLRPYFDVEPKDVLNRLLNSFLPTKSNLDSLSNELYGPLMLIFTLSAILIYEMKLANHSVVLFLLIIKFWGFFLNFIY
jgi:protein YIPF3